MFNFVTNLKKKYLSFKKTYKINLFYFKNKKSNFISSLENFSRTNKSKTWTNVNFSIFNFKINYRAFLYYLFQIVLILLFVYFKYDSVVYYFTEVLPFEIKLNVPAYLYILNTIFEFFLNLWWIFIFFINTSFINVIVFIDSNIINLTNINLNQYNFLYSIINQKNKKKNIKKKIKWSDLSKKTYSINAKLFKKKPYQKSNYPYEINLYDDITFLKNFNLFFYKISFNKFFKPSNSILELINYKNSNFSNFFNNILISQKNLIKNTKNFNYQTNSILWFLNKNLILNNIIFSNKFLFSLKKKYLYKNYTTKNNNSFFLLKNNLDFNSIFKINQNEKKISNFFKKF